MTTRQYIFTGTDPHYQNNTTYELRIRRYKLFHWEYIHIREVHGTNFNRFNRGWDRTYKSWAAFKAVWRLAI